MVAVGYCPLERLLSLMPWNCDGPPTARLVLATFLTPPTCGGILRPIERGDVRDGAPPPAATSPCGLAFTPQVIGQGGAGAGSNGTVSQPGGKRPRGVALWKRKGGR